MDFYIGALILGSILTFLALGIFLSLRVFQLPDITTDGSYTFGAVVATLALLTGMHWSVSLLLAAIAGFIAGSITSLIHTKLQVNSLLAGIIVMTGLYSINLKLMGRSNIPLPEINTIFTSLTPETSLQSALIISTALVCIVFIGIYYLLHTDFGLTLRATGGSETMIRSLGSNTHKVKLLGLGISNALIAVSGAIISQYQGFTDINMGIGIVVTGLGSVMLADALSKLLNWNSISAKLITVIIGSIAFRILIAMSLSWGVDPSLLKLISALLVLIFVALPQLKSFAK